MMKPIEPLLEQLRIVRNLTVSAFGALMKAGELRSEISDEITISRLSGLVHKIRSRFDSLKVLIQTFPEGAKSDGAFALAESIVLHASMIYDLLLSFGLEEKAEPFKHLCISIVAPFSQDKEETKSDASKDLLKESMRLPSQLKKLAPDLVAYYFCVIAAKKIASGIHLSGPDGFARIVREITFPPEYQQAGLSILNYFSSILHDKYPDIPVTVSIQQDPDKVTLIITLPDGSQDTVSKTLSDYGLVVIGKMTPRELLDDDIKALALQQKLELAQMEIRQVRDLLRIQDQYASKRVESLEVEVKNLYMLLGREFTSREALQSGLIQFVNQMATGHIGDQASVLVQSLASAIAERNPERTRVILEDIQSSEPTLFAKLNEFFLQAATSGVIGNYVYDWLKVLWPILPK